MAGIVQAVLTDTELEILQRWAELAGVEHLGTTKERSLLAKIDGYTNAVSCRPCKEGGSCPVPTRSVTPGDVRQG